MTEQPPEPAEPDISPATTTPDASILPVIGPAPAWQNEVWINSQPLSLEGLRGKVVLLEFWTFG